MHIMDAAREHIDDIVEIEKSCFTSPWTKNDFKSRLDSENVFFKTILEDDGKVIGYCLAETILDECSLYTVAVLPEYRNKGVGERLVRSLIEWAQHKELAFVTLEVRRSNVQAIALYTKLRFRIVGTRKDYYTSPNEDGLLMTRYFREINEV